MSDEIEQLDEDRLSEIIWKNVGLKPIREIAALTGLKPEDVLRRKNELLDSVDILSISQKRQRLLIELDGMARETRERARGVSDEFFSGAINASTGAIKTMLSELARAEKADTSRIESLNQKRVSELVNLMREVVDISVVEIATKHGLDEDDLYEVFNRRMVEAAEKRDVQ